MLYTNVIFLAFVMWFLKRLLKKQEMDMSTYLGQVQEVIEEFNKLISITANNEKQLEQQQKMFIVPKLVGLPSELDEVRDQILVSSSIPILDELFSRLLHLTAQSNSNPLTNGGFCCPNISNYRFINQTHRGGAKGGQKGVAKPLSPEIKLCI